MKLFKCFNGIITILLVLLLIMPFGCQTVSQETNDDSEKMNALAIAALTTIGFEFGNGLVKTRTTSEVHAVQITATNIITNYENKQPISTAVTESLSLILISEMRLSPVFTVFITALIDQKVLAFENSFNINSNNKITNISEEGVYHVCRGIIQAFNYSGVTVTRSVD